MSVRLMKILLAPIFAVAAGLIVAGILVYEGVTGKDVHGSHP